MSDQGESQSQPSIKDRIGAALSSREQPAPVEQVETSEVEALELPEPLQAEAPPEEAPPEEAQEATPTDDWVEVELEGEKLQVPPKWHKAFMQEKDYTQKRQADADRARIIEAREQGIEVREQALQALQPLYAQAHALESAVQQLNKLDWDTLRATDPVEYSAKRADYAALLQQRADLRAHIDQGHAFVNQKAQESLAAQVKAAEPLIRKVIPDWGPEKDLKLTKLALEKGASPMELQAFVSTRPWAIELMDAASKWYELQASKAQLPKRANLSPVAKPGAKPTHVSTEAALYRKNQETFRKSGGKDKTALRALIRAAIKPD